MDVLEQRDGRIIFSANQQSKVRIFGLLLTGLGVSILYWGADLGGPFSLSRFLEPLHFIRVAIAFTISYKLFKLSFSLLFVRGHVEISKVSGVVRRVSKCCGRTSVVEYQRSDFKEVKLRDFLAECLERNKLDEKSESKIARRYGIDLVLREGKGKALDENSFSLYVAKELEKVREVGEMAANILALSLQLPSTPQKSTMETEIIFKNDGPIVGSIFEEKCEGRDLTYSFYKVIAGTEDKLTLVRLPIASVGETGPGDRFGWLFPAIDSLETLPRDTEPDYRELDKLAAEEWEDSEEDELDEEHSEATDETESQQIIIKKTGTLYCDDSGNVFRRWDGIRKPFREV